MCIRDRRKPGGPVWRPEGNKGRVKGEVLVETLDVVERQTTVGLREDDETELRWSSMGT